MIFIIISTVIFLIICIILFFIFSSKQKLQSEAEVKKEESKAIISEDKTEIHIIVEEPKISKEKTTDPEEIKKEAEAIGKMLIAKNPNSPMPYKTLGDFYLSKGLKNEAIKKYKESIPFINNSIPYEKVKPIEDFLRSENLIHEADLIRKIYA